MDFRVFLDIFEIFAEYCFLLGFYASAVIEGPSGAVALRNFGRHFWRQFPDISVVGCTPRGSCNNTLRWGRGLPRARVGAKIWPKKFGMSLKTREIKLFGRDILGFWWDIPAVPEKFEKKNCVRFLALYCAARVQLQLDE